MDRKAKTESFENLDLSKPLKKNSLHIPENDCFAKEWDAYAKECVVCASVDVCAILCRDTVKNKIREIELEQRNSGAAFLDQAIALKDIKKDEVKIKKLILKRIGENEPITTDEILQLFETRYSVSDSGAVVNWIKEFIKNNSDLCIRERKFILKENTASND